MSLKKLGPDDYIDYVIALDGGAMIDVWAPVLTRNGVVATIAVLVSQRGGHVKVLAQTAQATKRAAIEDLMTALDEFEQGVAPQLNRGWLEEVSGMRTEVRS